MKAGHTKKDQRAAKLRAARKLLRALGVPKPELHSRAVALAKYNHGTYGDYELIRLLPPDTARIVRCYDKDCDCTTVELRSYYPGIADYWRAATAVI